ncbi:MAG: hypothetical protein HY832_02475 [Candidatus Aenigmarchaeota archaeon]|nr:hypothetical protein [Candidatus Aenigmarchaeota archaeon]
MNKNILAFALVLSFFMVLAPAKADLVLEGFSASSDATTTDVTFTIALRNAGTTAVDSATVPVNFGDSEQETVTFSQITAYNVATRKITHHYSDKKEYTATASFGNSQKTIKVTPGTGTGSETQPPTDQPILISSGLCHSNDMGDPGDHPMYCKERKKISDIAPNIPIGCIDKIELSNAHIDDDGVIEILDNAATIANFDNIVGAVAIGAIPLFQDFANDGIHTQSTPYTIDSTQFDGTFQDLSIGFLVRDVRGAKRDIWGDFKFIRKSDPACAAGGPGPGPVGGQPCSAYGACGANVCSNCHRLNKQYDIPSTAQSVCQGNFVLTTHDMVKPTYTCIAGGDGCALGDYENQVTKVISKTFCILGCSGQKCNVNARPVLYDARANDTVVKKDTAITINSTAQDPNMVYDEQGNSKGRNKITLYCGSHPGTVEGDQNPGTGDDGNPNFAPIDQTYLQSHDIDTTNTVSLGGAPQYFQGGTSFKKGWIKFTMSGLPETGQPVDTNDHKRVLFCLGNGDETAFVRAVHRTVDVGGGTAATDLYTIEGGSGPKVTKPCSMVNGERIVTGIGCGEEARPGDAVTASNGEWGVFWDGDQGVLSITSPTGGVQTMAMPGAGFAFSYIKAGSGCGGGRSDSQQAQIGTITSKDLQNAGTSGFCSIPSVAVSCLNAQYIIPGQDPVDWPDTVHFTPDVCQGKIYNYDNPSCSFTNTWTASGEQKIYCRAFDRHVYSNEEKEITIIADNTKPTTGIIFPSSNTEQSSNFVVKTSDVDANKVSKCYYAVKNVGDPAPAWRERECNSDVEIKVGPGQDCSTQGTNTCLVQTKAVDTAGNENVSVISTYSITFVTSKIIVDPEEADVFHATKFAVEVSDIDKSGVGFEGGQAKCDYEIKVNNSHGTYDSNGGWKPRVCNAPFDVTVGSDAECSSLGPNSCMVSVRAYNANGVGGIVDDAFFNIDYLSPETTITAPDAGTWQAVDFPVVIQDTAPAAQTGITLATCEYAVTIKNQDVEELSWKQRVCNEGVRLIVGADGECSAEGGNACTIFARSTATSGRKSSQVNRTFSIAPAGVAIDGFASVEAVEDDTGLNLSGTLKNEFRLNPVIFYACSADASPTDCQQGYDQNICGKDKACLCGSVVGMKCAVACNDQNLTYYLQAYGQSFADANSQTVISSIHEATCPTFDIGRIEFALKQFHNFENTIIMLKGMYDYQLGQSDVDESVKTRIRNVLIPGLSDAERLTQDQLAVIEKTMQDLSKSKAKKLLEQTEEVRLKIAAIINFLLGQGTYEPLKPVVAFERPLPIAPRVNTPDTADVVTPIDVVAWKEGGIFDTDGQSSVDLYGIVTCDVTKPITRVTLHNQTSCLHLGTQNDPTHALQLKLVLDEIGTWNIGCSLVTSTQTDCSMTRPGNSTAGSFMVVPPEALWISAVNLPPKIIKNNTPVQIDVSVHNPDSHTRFVNASCVIEKPSRNVLLVTKNSECLSIGAGNDASYPIGFTVDATGLWKIRQCSIAVSAFDGCASSSIDNVTMVQDNFTVIPKLLGIHHIKPPKENLKLGDVAEIWAELENLYTQTLNASVECSVLKPSGESKIVASDISEIAPGVWKNYTMVTTVDVEGTWTVDNCIAYRIGSKIQEDMVDLNEVFSVASDQTSTPPATNTCAADADCAHGYYCKNTVCTLNTTCTTDTNCAQGYICKQLVCVLNQTQTPANKPQCSVDRDCQTGYTCNKSGSCVFSECPGTDMYCYAENAVCKPCPSGYVCTNHLCENSAQPQSVPCIKNDQCETGQICSYGKCLVASQTCQDSTDCDSGSTCINGACVIQTNGQNPPGLDSGSSGNTGGGFPILWVGAGLILIGVIGAGVYLYKKRQEEEEF